MTAQNVDASPIRNPRRPLHSGEASTPAPPVELSSSEGCSAGRELPDRGVTRVEMKALTDQAKAVWGVEWFLRPTAAVLIEAPTGSLAEAVAYSALADEISDAAPEVAAASRSNPGATSDPTAPARNSNDDQTTRGGGHTPMETFTPDVLELRATNPFCAELVAIVPGTTIGLFAAKRIFTVALHIGTVGAPTYDDAYCYMSEKAVLEAIRNWDIAGGQTEPVGWHRHNASGRRRPFGDASREYINL